VCDGSTAANSSYRYCSTQSRVPFNATKLSSSRAVERTSSASTERTTSRPAAEQLHSGTCMSPAFVYSQ
jgi:hypothetical protein